jgi:hypothetical protein
MAGEVRVVIQFFSLLDTLNEGHTVQSPKFILTIVWNPIGFHVLKALPKERKFNAQ